MLLIPLFMQVRKHVFGHDMQEEEKRADHVSVTQAHDLPPFSVIAKCFQQLFI